MITRRGFLVSLASLPLLSPLGSRLSRWRFLDTEFGLRAEGFPWIMIRMFTNGDMEARFDGQLMQVFEDRGWLRCIYTSPQYWVETRIRRQGMGVLDVDWISMATPSCVMLDDFWSVGEHIGTAKNPADSVLRLQ